MPELPEVETIVRSLNQSLPGERIKRVWVHRGSVVREQPERFAQSLQGRRFAQVQREGKYLIFWFETGKQLLAHLGMSGKFILDLKPNRSTLPHDRVVFALSKGQLVFSDVRCFGFLEYTEANRSHPRLGKLGKDALTDPYSPKELQQAWGQSRRAIKTLLLEQAPLAGIGNIYGAEILFSAQIHPASLGKDLKISQLKKLIHQTKRILNLALEHNGTSISDYRQIDNKTGEFQRFLQVYGKAGQPCPVCSTPILKEVLSQRSSFYCAHCQKK